MLRFLLIAGCYTCFSGKKRRELIKKLLQNGGTVYVKLGQSLSLKPYLIGAELANCLQTLQEQAFDGGSAKNIPQLSFASLPHLVSSGSVANVYKARLIEEEAADNNKGEKVSSEDSEKAAEVWGDEIAIKIVKTYLFKKTKRDLKNLEHFCKFLHLFKKFHALDLPSIAQNISKITLGEFDMDRELANNFLLKQNIIFWGDDLAEQGAYRAGLPAVYKKYSTNNILVQKWVEGHSLNEIVVQNLLSKAERERLAKGIILIYLNQVYNDGVFHADMHLGNIMFCPAEEKVYLIDCGNVSQISQCDRLAVAKILYFFLKKNFQKAAEQYIKAGYVSASVNMDEFSAELEKLAQKTFEGGRGAVSGILGKIIEITQKFELKTQPQLLMLQKTILYVESCVYALCPNFDIWQVIKPWMKHWAFKNSPLKAKVVAVLQKLENGRGLFDKIYDNLFKF